MAIVNLSKNYVMYLLHITGFYSNSEMHFIHRVQQKMSMHLIVSNHTLTLQVQRLPHVSAGEVWKAIIPHASPRHPAPLMHIGIYRNGTKR